MYTTVYINQSLQARADLMVEMVRRFGVDGVVFHSNRSCKPYSLGQYELLERVTDRTGVPAVILEADMCDSRPDMMVWKSTLINSCRTDEYRLFGRLVLVVERQRAKAIAGSIPSEEKRRT